MRTFRYVLTAIFSVSLSACGVDKEELQEDVLASIQYKFDNSEKYEKYEMEVTNVRLINEAGNKYRGTANIAFIGNSYSVSVDVISDGQELLWEIPPMELSFIAEYTDREIDVQEGSLVENMQDPNVRSWAVVVGNFGNPKNAERLVSHLQSISFEAYTVEDDGMNIVIVGHADNEDAAYELKNKIQEHAMITGTVINDTEFPGMKVRETPPELLTAPSNLR